MTTRTWRAKRRIGAAALVALIGSTLAFASSATAITALGDAESARLSGDNRAGTAADIYLDADNGWDAENSVYDVTIVNGNNFPDGLAASIYNNPILLVNADSIPAETSAALAAAELGADVLTITIVGGTSVVSSAVLEQLDALNGTDPVVRVAGEDRYSTAAAVAADYIGLGNECDMILATGDNFPDALAAGPLAIDADAPILLNTGDSLLPINKTTIATYLGGGGCYVGVPTIHIVGGTAAVPASVEAELQSMGINVNRIAGANRAETAVAIAGVIAAVGGYTPSNFSLVNGNGFADALAAGPNAWHEDSVLMLVDVDSIPAATAAAHVASCVDLTDDPHVVAYGGTAVISDAVLAAADAAATCSVPTYTATVATVAQTQAVYTATEPAAMMTAGVTFTAVAGNAADGAAGNAWTITIGDSGGDPTDITVDASGPSVDVTIKDYAADGISQADLVALWNADPGASALFTAAPDGSSGSPAAYTGAAITMVNTDPGTTTQQLVFTFSEDVDDCDLVAGAVLEDDDFTVDGDAVVAAVSSPLPATAGGASVYTFTTVAGAVADIHAVGEAVDAAGCSVANGSAVVTAAGQALTAG